ncbi:methyltransferase domain-containing protein [Streptomyces sp. NPDC048638]|uniref:methyltransferase domain-containing protein n=1 Tax=Streptomyces sp. NPDC048638 TaxID=3365580 RepID=UPI003717DD81
MHSEDESTALAGRTTGTAPTTGTTRTPRTPRTPRTDTARTTGAGPEYVHGYSPQEAQRLGDQADTLAALLHSGTSYPAGSRVLEAGCGVGAQTVHLVESSPGARIVAVDRSAASLAQARAHVAAARPPGAPAAVAWQQADVYELPFQDASFDAVFLCFVLEHLADPVRALGELRRVLRPGGSLTVIEGDHGSALFHPFSHGAHTLVAHLIRLQADAGGNALIGRELQPLLTSAGFRDAVVRPRTVYVDGTRPALVEGFTRRTFIAMVEAVREDALRAGLTTAADWDRGMAGLRRAAADDGSFHYTFFKAVAVRAGATSPGSLRAVSASAGMHANSLTPGASSAASFT